MLAFASAGLFAHTVFLFHQAIRSMASNNSFLTAREDWFFWAAWVLAATYLLSTYRYPNISFGLFVLPLTLGLIGVGRFVAEEGPFARAPASEMLGMVHGVSTLLAVVSVLVGFIAALMYLGQARRLKHSAPPATGLRLPSLEWLRQANRRALLTAAAMLAVGIVSGFALRLIGDDGAARRLTWSDPAVLATVILFFWLLMHIGIAIIYRPAREGRKVAYFTVVSLLFLLLVIAIAMSIVADTGHGGGRAKALDRAVSGVETPGTGGLALGCAESDGMLVMTAFKFCSTVQATSAAKGRGSPSPGLPTDSDPRFWVSFAKAGRTLPSARGDGA